MRIYILGRAAGARPFVEGSDVYAHAACDVETHDRRDDGPRPRPASSSRPADDVGDDARVNVASKRMAMAHAARCRTRPITRFRSQISLNPDSRGQEARGARLLAHCGHPVIDLKTACLWKDPPRRFASAGDVRPSHGR